jgi:hypothetical protein
VLTLNRSRSLTPTGRVSNGRLLQLYTFQNTFILKVYVVMQFYYFQVPVTEFDG